MPSRGSDSSKNEESLFFHFSTWHYPRGGTTKPLSTGVYSTMISRYEAVWKGLVILLALGHVFPCSAGGQEVPPRLLQEDFQILRHALEMAHGGLYRYTSKAEMD